jgi:hypothetical protein
VRDRAPRADRLAAIDVCRRGWRGTPRSASSVATISARVAHSLARARGRPPSAGSEGGSRGARSRWVRSLRAAGTRNRCHIPMSRRPAGGILGSIRRPATVNVVPSIDKWRRRVTHNAQDIARSRDGQRPSVSARYPTTKACGRTLPSELPCSWSRRDGIGHLGPFAAAQGTRSEGDRRPVRFLFLERGTGVIALRVVACWARRATGVYAAPLMPAPRLP